MARSHVYGFVSTITRVSSTRSRHISCGADLVLLPARDTSRRSSRTPRALALSPRRKTGVGGGCLLSTQARYSGVLRDGAPPLPKMLWPWSGVVARVSSLPRVICTRHVPAPLRPLISRWAPFTVRLFCWQGGSIVVGHTLWEQRLSSRMSDRR